MSERSTISCTRDSLLFFTRCANTRPQTHQLPEQLPTARRTAAGRVHRSQRRGTCSYDGMHRRGGRGAREELETESFVRCKRVQYVKVNRHEHEV